MEHPETSHALIGRNSELRRLSEAMSNRESLLIWGPAGAGKTALAAAAICGLPAKVRRNCIYSSGAVSVKRLAGELVRGLALARDAVVCKKVGDAGTDEASLDQWLRGQTSGRLKRLLFTALPKGRYWIFLDHLAPSSQPMARLIKDLIWRCKAPVYLLARGCTHREIGYAWSSYFADRYRIAVGSVSASAAQGLFDQCNRQFGLAPVDLEKFREEVLRLSGRIPGRIVKMCALAADPRYLHAGRMKTKLLHVDYLMAQIAGTAEFAVPDIG